MVSVFIPKQNELTTILIIITIIIIATLAGQVELLFTDVTESMK